MDHSHCSKVRQLADFLLERSLNVIIYRFSFPLNVFSFSTEESSCIKVTQGWSCSGVGASCDQLREQLQRRWLVGIHGFFFF